MIIIEMILKITGWNQEELAKFLGVSRVSVNCWLHGNDISISSKKLISEKFKFPLNFFNVNLDEDIEYYKLIYKVLYENIKLKTSSNTKEVSVKEKVNDILNRIEFDDKTVNKNEITSEDIIDALLNAYDPFTGEVFDNNHILNNVQVKEIIASKLAVNEKNNKFSSKITNFDQLNESQKALFNSLKEWRIKKMNEEGFNSAYLIMGNRTFYNLIDSKISNKQDLLKVKGIGEKTYLKYGDDIFNILKGNI